MTFQIVPECALGSGDCGVCDFIVLGINIVNLLAGIAGLVAMISFIIGGLMWIFAFGKEDLIKKGQEVIKNTVIGLAIMVFAWVGVNFIIHALSGQELNNVTIFSAKWWQPECEDTINSDCSPEEGEVINIGEYCNNSKNWVCYREQTEEHPGNMCTDTSPCQPITQCEYIGEVTKKDCSCAASCATTTSQITGMGGLDEVSGEYCDGGQKCCCE